MYVDNRKPLLQFYVKSTIRTNGNIWSSKSTKIDFTENLNGITILKFPHSAYSQTEKSIFIFRETALRSHFTAV